MKQKVQKNAKITYVTPEDPLRAYRFTSIVRHLISALYGILLGYAIMAGNRTVNFFVIFLSIIEIYIFIKGLCGRFLVKIKLIRSETDIVRGCPAEVTAHIRNYTPFFYPVSFFLVKDGNNPEGQRVFIFLRPFANINQNFTFTVNHCGTYPLKTSLLRLISAGGMVWVKAFIKKKETASVSVVPEICQSLFSPDTAEGSGGSVTSQKFSISATDSFFLRQYQPGDDPRYIHWKRSAAREDWLLKGFYREGEHKYIVLLDARLPGGVSRNKLAKKEPFTPEEDEIALAKADRVSAAAVSICASLYVDEAPFIFACPNSSGTGEELISVTCESSAEFANIRRIAGTTDFLPSEANPVEDSKLPPFLRTALSVSDESVTIIRISAMSALRSDGNASSVYSADGVYSPDPAMSAAAGNGCFSGENGSDSFDPVAYKRNSDNPSGASSSSSGNSSTRRRKLSNLLIDGMPGTEFYGEEFPGAYIISVEVNV